MTQTEHVTTGTGVVAHRTLDRLTARALDRVRQGQFPAATGAARDWLYRRMFPDDVCEGSLSHADMQTRT